MCTVVTSPFIETLAKSALMSTSLMDSIAQREPVMLRNSHVPSNRGPCEGNLLSTLVNHDVNPKQIFLFWIHLSAGDAYVMNIIFPTFHAHTHVRKVYLNFLKTKQVVVPKKNKYLFFAPQRLFNKHDSLISMTITSYTDKIYSIQDSNTLINLIRYSIPYYNAHLADPTKDLKLANFAMS